MNPQNTALPTPTRARWQPLRIGLVDLYQYDYEEWRFRDGRLLLRGNNGTGKSKVMALALPFLLDGRLTPGRVEPDGDGGKRMEWNLLLGGRYAERQGYSWIEFGRLHAGQAEYFTVGCGLKAVAGRGAPRSWFFTTPQRIGGTLFLMESGRTLSRERLIEALGDRGQIHDTGEAHRRAVDERLFQLGPERYEALVNLLIQLRQPQLSKKPDPAALSRTLTEALPPLDQAVLAEVADAFRNLDAERDELTALTEAARAVDEFLEHYREYARICTRRRGQQLRTAHSRYEECSAQLNHRRGQLAECSAQQERREEEIATTDAALATAQQAQRTLETSPEMRSATELRHAETAAGDKQRTANQQVKILEQANELLRRGERHVATESDALAATEAALAAQLNCALDHAETAGIRTRFGALIAPLALPTPPADTPIAEVERAMGELLARRREAVAHLKRLNGTAEGALVVQEQSRTEWQRSLDRGEQLDGLHLEAVDRVRERSEELVRLTLDYCRGLTEIPVGGREELRGELADWVVTLAGPNPATVRLDAAKDRAISALAGERARNEQELAILEGQRQQLEVERDRLLAGEDARPPPPHTRDPRTRENRPGAPLWQLVDFAPATSAEQRAGLEAALEAAGLLDAWLLPDGLLLAPEADDTLLRADATPVDAGLGRHLVPAIDHDDPRAGRIADETVARVLAAIGCEEGKGAIWTTVDGRWGVGPAFGHWHKPAAQYIGRGAREAARRRRLAAIGDELAELEQAVAALHAQLNRLRARGERLEQEWRARPDDSPLRAAHHEEAAAARARRDHQPIMDAAAERLRLAREQFADATRVRDEAAADLQLPVDPTALEAVAEATGELRLDWNSIATGVRQIGQQRRRLAELAQERATLSERVADQTLAHEQAQREARDAKVHYETLREMVGAAVDAVLRRLAETKEQITILIERQKRLNQDRFEAGKQITQLETEIRADVARLDELNANRITEIGRLRVLAEEKLLRIALPDAEPLDPTQSWNPDPAVRLARRIGQQLTGVDDSDAVWNRNQKGLHQHFSTLAAALSRYGHEAIAEQTDDLLLVRIVFQGRQRSPDELAEGLQAEITARRALLDNRERELIERHLVSDLASHLQERISAAEQQVARMNEELKRRPTSTGMKLQLAWQPLEESQEGAPAGLAEARKRLLRQVIDAWSKEDRDAVGNFLKQRIDAARSAEESGSLLELLARALDYRHWHRFVVERFQDGKWRPAYGPASGGERALVITIPLFAAASSHYGSAGSDAPRLVLLDEAFAGIDDDSRAKCMGLLAQFDLDIMMTSEREWGCYPEVPGLSICQLVRREGVDAVLVSRWLWDGHQRRRDEAPLPPAETLSVETADDAAGTTGSLF